MVLVHPASGGMFVAEGFESCEGSGPGIDVVALIGRTPAVVQVPPTSVPTLSSDVCPKLEDATPTSVSTLSSDKVRPKLEDATLGSKEGTFASEVGGMLSSAVTMSNSTVWLQVAPVQFVEHKQDPSMWEQDP